MTGTITLYAQTHFNGIDIPAEPSVLNLAQVVTILNNVYYTRMDVDLSFIDLDIQYSGVRDVDYVKIHDNQDNMNYYYRAIPAAMAKGSTRLALKLDALLTLGGAVNCEYLSGWQERGHIPKADDILFNNVASESWVPSKPLENTAMVSVTGEGNPMGVGNAGMDLCISNVDLIKLGQWNNKIEALATVDLTDVTDPKSWLPAIKAPIYSTDFTIYDQALSQPHSFNLPRTSAYDLSDATVKQGIENLYACGQLALQASYNIPKEYIGGVSQTVQPGRISSIVGYYGTKAITQLPYEYTQGNYTVKNKKCFATYRYYNIVSLASGDLSCKEPEKLYKSGDTYPSVLVWADPCSTGKPYARFSHIKSSPNLWTDCVRGLQWSNSQIVIEGASGSLWNSLDMAYSNQMIGRNKERSLFANQVNTNLNNIAYDQASLDYDRQSINTAVDTGQAFVDAAGAAVDAATFGMASKGASYVLDKDKPLTSLKNYTDAVDQNKATSAQASSSLAGAIYGGVARIGNNIYQQVSANPKQYNMTQKRLDEQAGLLNYESAFIKSDAAISINKNGLDAFRANNVVAPNVSFTPEQNLGLYGYNSFVVYETRKSLEDLKSEDDYYQRYGYSGLHKPLTADAFKARAHYNFVQAFDINLKGLYSLGARVEAAAILQLNGGVRVWRDQLPNAQAYETN